MSTVAASTRLRNPAELLGWNLDKEHLRDLEAAGIPIVDTTWVNPSDGWDAPTPRFVIKPAISGGGRETAGYDPGQRAEAESMASSATQSS